MAENPQARKAEIAGLYNRVAANYGRVGPDIFSTIGQNLVKLIHIHNGEHVLDVATGRGANLFAAVECVGPGGSVIGVDLAEKMVQETRQEIQHRNIHNVVIDQMDAEHLEFPDNTFDVVLCGFAIFFFPSIEQALTEFIRVLHPGGKLGMTSGRNPDKVSHWYGKRLVDYHQRYHFPLSAGISTTDLHSLPAFLLHAGMADVQVIEEQHEFVYTDEQQWWNSRWTQGQRYSLEHMPTDVLQQFKNEIFATLRENTAPDGIHEAWQIQYIIATKRKESNPHGS